MIGMGNPGILGDAPLGMSPRGCDYCGKSPCECDEYDHAEEAAGNEVVSGRLKTVSKEDCCTAVLCLIECCSCEETKAKLRQVCDEIMNKSDDYNSPCG